MPDVETQSRSPTRHILRVTLPLVLLAGASGWYLGSRGSAPASPSREVLYWVDPMNPAFRSAEPGVAPCGMPLEPVYADGSGPSGNAGNPGTLRVSADRRQLVGIVIELASSAPMEGTLRLSGQVAADERFVHVVATQAVNRVDALGVADTGSLVDKGDFLVALDGDRTSSTQRTLIRALDELDAKRRDDPGDQHLILRLERTVQASTQSLLANGMSQDLVERIKRTRLPVSSVEVKSPASGYVLSRRAVLGEEYPAFATLYVIADIRRVFVLVNVLNEDLELIRSGVEAEVHVPGRSRVLEAHVDASPAEFDPAFNGLKIRLEVDNPERILLPEMFVDVEIPIRTEETLSVPAGAVVDSGMRRRVYVDLGEGRFEPREVRIGWQLGDRVQILDGLVPGDAVVVSGNFLLDSESRMRASNGGSRAARPLDAVCGMQVDIVAARDAGLVSERDGESYFFCSGPCKQRFDENPGEFVTGDLSP